MVIRCFLLLCILAMLICPAWAQSITVNVSGSVQQSACTPNLQGTLYGGNTVTLPNVQTADLAAPGTSVSQTELRFRAYGCTGNVNYMWVYFTSPQVDTNGRMIPTSGTTNIRFEIRDNSSGGSLVRVGGSAGSAPGSDQGSVASFSGSHPANSNREATKYYFVRYYVHQPVTMAGNVSTTATANFKYY